MNESRRGKRRKQPSPMQRLYREFAEFYVRERAAWVAKAPERDRWAPATPAGSSTWLSRGRTGRTVAR